MAANVAVAEPNSVLPMSHPPPAGRCFSPTVHYYCTMIELALSTTLGLGLNVRPVALPEPDAPGA